MNNHNELNHISTYLDGQLSKEKRATFEDHLEDCVLCQSEVRAQQDIKRYLHAFSPKAAPRELLLQLKRTYGAVTWVARLRQSFSAQLMWKPVGVLALVMVALTVWVMNRAPQESEFIDFESIAALHDQYHAASLIPQADMVNSQYSAHLASYVHDDNE